MTPTERLRDLVPGLPIEQLSNGACATLPDGTEIVCLSEHPERVLRVGGRELWPHHHEGVRAALESTASAWMDAILGPLTDGELVDVADPEAHYTDGREVGPLRSFDITPRMKRTLANMPDEGKLIVGDAVWSRVPKEASNGVLDYVVAANAEEWADYMALRREAIPLRIARLPLLTGQHAIRVDADGKILPTKETP